MTAGNGPQRVFHTFFERGNVFKMQADEPETDYTMKPICSSGGVAKYTFSE